MNIPLMADKAMAVCDFKKWDRDWSAAGCYLHLEASELIEALRGKGKSTAAEEAADVLFVLLSMCRGNNISLEEVERIFHAKCDALLDFKAPFFPAPKDLSKDLYREVDASLRILQEARTGTPGPIDQEVLNNRLLMMRELLDKLFGPRVREE